MKVARSPVELPRARRAVALGTFDGVHLGHRRVLEAAQQPGLTTTVVTFDPHPRTALGNRVELLSSLDRRLELLAERGVEETLVVGFTLELAKLGPEAFAAEVLAPLGTEVVVAGADFRFGHRRQGDLATLAALGFDTRPVDVVEGVSSTRIRELAQAGQVEDAAALLGRPVEVEGTVVAGDARGETLGYPTANLDVRPELLVPAFGIYAGEALDHRAAVSIGMNPHYGGRERRVEAYLLDFDGDLYGKRVLLELWSRLRAEMTFASEQDLVAQIGRDVEAARTAARPV